MTKEEIVKIAKGLRTDFKCESDIMVDFCNSIIKELEQEPFINKLCVSSGVCEHDKNKVLDKIRAEIEQRAKPNELGGRGNGKAIRCGLCIALGIIDKYKTGSEGK